MGLGGVAIIAGERLPNWIDPVMERVVGATLLLLAVLLVHSLRRGDTTRVSRGVLLFGALAAARDRLRRSARVEVRHAHAHCHDRRHEHGHAHIDALEETHAPVITAHKHAHVHAVDVTSYSSRGAVAVGLLHGVGAETGTQALVLVSAAGVASTAAGVAVLGAFVIGIVATTALIALGTALGWKLLSGRGRAYTYLTIGTAVASAAVGLMYVSGQSGTLPGILGG
jgi:high-affinity nickel-transport protein